MGRRHQESWSHPVPGAGVCTHERVHTYTLSLIYFVQPPSLPCFIEEEAGVQRREATCLKSYPVINWQSRNSNSNLPELKALPATPTLVSQDTQLPFTTEITIAIILKVTSCHAVPQCFLA